jgi:histidyl-tRNA synthetase
MKKQMTYANNQAIPFVILAGDQEIESGKLTFKNMETGNQESLTVEEIIEKLKYFV